VLILRKGRVYVTNYFQNCWCWLFLRDCIVFHQVHIPLSTSCRQPGRDPMRHSLVMTDLSNFSMHNNMKTTQLRFFLPIGLFVLLTAFSLSAQSALRLPE